MGEATAASDDRGGPVTAFDIVAFILAADACLLALAVWLDWHLHRRRRGG